MRLRYLPVSLDFFISVCKNPESHVKLVANGLPPDAKAIRAGHDNFGWLNIIIESCTFDDVEEGGEIPMHPRPLFEKVYAQP